MPGRRRRLDLLLVERGLVPSRTEAQRWIEEGRVRVGGFEQRKPGSLVDPDQPLSLDPPGQTWVSRGAHKLLEALERFPVDPKGKVCLDVGASTGGFTQVLLRRGALRVHALDVGYGQLAWVLRTDPRVVVRERTNARDLCPELLGESCSLGVCDASFISLRLLLGPMISVLDPEGDLVTLLKPQFEAGRDRIGKRGVVQDPRVHGDVIREILHFVEERTPRFLWGAVPSPIRGPEGNLEFLLHLRGRPCPDPSPDVDALVERAHRDIPG